LLRGYGFAGHKPVTAQHSTLAAAVAFNAGGGMRHPAAQATPDPNVFLT